MYSKNLFDVFFENRSNSYPPYNLVKVGEDKIILSLALAGFRKDEISITETNGVLTISGSHVDTDEKEYLYKGIGSRSFENRWKLYNYFKVESAEMVDGMLSVTMSRVVPSDDKKIEIK